MVQEEDGVGFLGVGELGAGSYEVLIGVQESYLGVRIGIGNGYIRLDIFYMFIWSYAYIHSKRGFPRVFVEVLKCVAATSVKGISACKSDDLLTL